MSDQQQQPQPQAPRPIGRRNGVVALLAVGLVAGMVGLSFASVPLYRLFCQVTGFGGTTQVADQAQVHKMSESDVVRKIMLAPQPTRQFVQPEEIAELALYLSADLARSITGAAISIDGGWTAK